MTISVVVEPSSCPARISACASALLKQRKLGCHPAQPPLRPSQPALQPLRLLEPLSRPSDEFTAIACCACLRAREWQSTSVVPASLSLTPTPRLQRWLLVRPSRAPRRT